MSCLVGCVGKGIKYVSKWLVENYIPLLSRSSCKNMGLIQCVNAIESDSILDEFPEVFQGLGCLPGIYHISVDPFVLRVVHPSRRVPHSK